MRLRCFVALSLPDAARDALCAIRDRLPSGRPASDESLHLTLAFLGDQDPVQLRELHDRLAALPVPGLTLQATELGFLGGSAPALVAAMVAADPALSRLRDDVRRACRGAGIELPRERFRPHVTLLRLRRRIAPAEIDRLRRAVQEAGRLGVAFSPPDMRLVQSTLMPDGAIHEPLAVYPSQLAGGGPRG